MYNARDPPVKEIVIVPEDVPVPDFAPTVVQEGVAVLAR